MGMGLGGLAGHIAKLAGAEVDVRAQQQPRVGIHARASLQPAPLDQPIQHVAVARELARVDHHGTPIGSRVERGCGQLVEVDRGRVADHDLPPSGAQRDLAQPVSDRGRKLDPVRPAAHQPPPPLVRPCRDRIQNDA
jgi:hypothetical protein